MFVAIDVGGTKTLVAVFDEDGKVIARDKHPTGSDFDTFLDQTISAVEKLTKDDDVDVIVVAAPGLIDYENNRVLDFGNFDWHNVDMHSPLAQRFECPVIVENDANLGAVGEANLGAGEPYETVLYITISTGIGTGITYQGALDRAMRKSEGGQMHFRHDGKLMRWEHFASGKAFYDRYQKMGVDVPIGDEIWSQWAEDVSLGVGSLLAVIQPDAVVIGGSMGEHLEKYRSPLLNALQLIRSPVVRIPPIEAAKDPHNAVINGCYITAKRYAENF